MLSARAADHSNQFAWSKCDALNRLTGTKTGTLDGSGHATGVLKHTDTWKLDLLGNWVGDGAYPGRESTRDLGNNAVETRSSTHTINERNELTFVDYAASNAANPPPPVDTTTIYDQSGNLVYDGLYFYQYDAWGRLIQINRAAPVSGSPGPESFPPSAPSTCLPSNIAVGAMLKHFTYDGLGRLVRVQSPWPDPDNANGGVRSERFYYDGARRIQELVTDPIASIELIQGTTSQGENLALGETMVQTVPTEVLATGDGSATPLSFESAQLNNPQEITSPSGEPLPTSLSGLEREYIWGPGDNGLDEILVQYDIERKAFWMIQDGGGDVVAMCDLQGSGGTARVVKSWQYDAYGQCLRATDVVATSSSYSIPQNRVGHKGLFMDRLDKGLTNYDPVTGYTENLRLEPFSTVLYQNRNRTYSPQLGRFIQRDPNETGQFGSNPAKHGGVATRPGAEFELSESYQDGGSLHEYLGSSTLLRRDPMGHGFYIDLIVSTALRAGMFVLPGPRDMMVGASQGLIKGYALNQDEDVEWALDWNRLDDEHSRLDSQWMFYAMARGVYDSYEFGYGDYTFNPLDSFDPDAFETDQAGGPVAAFTRPPRFINPKGATGKLPAGYTYRVDSNDVSAAEGNFHIHVYKGSKQTKNNEVAKVTGNGGYVNHGGTNLRRASDMPREVRRDLNRIVRLARREGRDRDAW